MVKYLILFLFIWGLLDMSSCCSPTPPFSNYCAIREKREFVENPVEVNSTCDRNNEGTINKRWRGELSIAKHGTYVEIDWKKTVQDHRCVRAMEFFVDGEKEKDIWGAHKETVRINKSKKFSLKVEVFFTISGTQGRCYGSRSRCQCFEATTDVDFSKKEEKDFF